MTLNDAVIQLHYIAGLVEKEIGQGQLSDDIRKNANSLSDLIKVTYTKAAA